jgi:hypothetical protein
MKWINRKDQEPAPNKYEFILVNALSFNDFKSDCEFAPVSCQYIEGEWLCVSACFTICFEYWQPIEILNKVKG